VVVEARQAAAASGAEPVSWRSACEGFRLWSTACDLAPARDTPESLTFKHHKHAARRVIFFISPGMICSAALSILREFMKWLARIYLHSSPSFVDSFYVFAAAVELQLCCAPKLRNSKRI